MFMRFFGGLKSKADFRNQHDGRTDDCRDDDRDGCHDRDDDRHHGRDRDDDRQHGRDRDDDRHDGHEDDACDNGYGGGHSGGGGTGGGTGGGSGGTGSGFPQIAANTAGITFHLDWTGDGAADEYQWIPRQDTDTTGTPTFEDYYRVLLEDLRAANPDADLSGVTIKATIYGPNAEETYYYFTGDETLDDDSAEDPSDDDRCEEDRDDDRDHDRDDDRDHDRHDDRGHDRDDDRGHDRDDDRDEDHDSDSACNSGNGRGDGHDRHGDTVAWDDDAEFFRALAEAVGTVCENDTPPEDPDDDGADDWDC